MKDGPKGYVLTDEWDINKFLGIEIKEITKNKGFVIWLRFDFIYSVLDYCFRVYFGTATYVDYLMFSHLNPITNRPRAKRNPNYRGNRMQP